LTTNWERTREKAEKGRNTSKEGRGEIRLGQGKLDLLTTGTGAARRGGLEKKRRLRSEHWISAERDERSEFVKKKKGDPIRFSPHIFRRAGRRDKFRNGRNALLNNEEGKGSKVNHRWTEIILEGRKRQTKKRARQIKEKKITSLVKHPPKCTNSAS